MPKFRRQEKPAREKCDFTQNRHFQIEIWQDARTLAQIFFEKTLKYKVEFHSNSFFPCHSVGFSAYFGSKFQFFSIFAFLAVFEEQNGKMPELLAYSATYLVIYHISMANNSYKTHANSFRYSVSSKCNLEKMLFTDILVSREPLLVETWFTPHFVRKTHFSNSVSYIVYLSDERKCPKNAKRG
jgi:hypothetical protein